MEWKWDEMSVLNTAQLWNCGSWSCWNHCLLGEPIHIMHWFMNVRVSWNIIYVYIYVCVYVYRLLFCCMFLLCFLCRKSRTALLRKNQSEWIVRCNLWLQGRFSSINSVAWSHAAKGLAEAHLIQAACHLQSGAWPSKLGTVGTVGTHGAFLLDLT